MRASPKSAPYFALAASAKAQASERVARGSDQPAAGSQTGSLRVTMTLTSRADQRDAGGDQRDADRGSDADRAGDDAAEIGRGDHDGEHEDGAQWVFATPAAALRQWHEHDQVVFANLCLAPSAAQHRPAIAQTDRRALERVDAPFAKPVANGERLGDGSHLPIPLRAKRVVQHDDGAGHQVSPMKR